MSCFCRAYPSPRVFRMPDSVSWKRTYWSKSAHSWRTGLVISKMTDGSPREVNSTALPHASSSWAYSPSKAFFPLLTV